MLVPPPISGLDGNPWLLISPGESVVVPSLQWGSSGGSLKKAW